MSDVVDRAAHAFVGAWTWLAQRLDNGVHGEHDGVVVAATGLPAPPLNPAFVVREPTRPEESLRWAAALRRERGAPSTGVDLPDARFPETEAALERLGFVRHVSRPGMSAAVDGVRRRPAPGGLDIRPVRSEADWVGYVEVQVDAFGLDPAIAAEFPPYRLVGPDRPMELLVGAVDGEVTCAVATFVTGRDAGIFAVATRSTHRGEGHGSAITTAAVNVAARMGAEVVSLQSTADGFPVYRALGFVETAAWVVWVDPAVEPGAD
ncbi:MAG TPA: GNAT family N-acetyltransferase [Mycobacteriales bacterium]|nr:GNAT family N-acetyltransferase [Mycobacteriales bacterium]